MTMEVNVNVAPAAREWQAMADKFGAGLAKTLAGVGRASGAVASGVGEGAGTAKVGTQIEKLVRSFPGGGMMTDIGKAFKTGGPVVGMFAGLNTIIGFFKGALSQSKIFSAVSGTFFKIVGMMIDMMLMPLLPYFMRFLQWFMAHGTKFATDVGKTLAEWVPKIGGWISAVNKGMEKIGGWKPYLIAIAVTWFGAWMIAKAMQAAKALKKGFGAAKKGVGALKGLKGRMGGNTFKTVSKTGQVVKRYKAGTVIKGVKVGGQTVAKKAGLFGRMTGGLGRGLGGVGRGIGGIGRGIGGIGRGAAGLGRGALGLAGRGAGGIGRGVMGGAGLIGRGTMGALRGVGGIGGGRVAALGGRLASKTGLKAVARIGTGIVAKRGGAMLSGALMGGAIGGVAGAGVGAIPGALIGAIAGLVIGQATGVAIDAATGKGFDVKRAAIPGYSEVQDINEAFFKKTGDSMSKNAKEIGAATDRIGQGIEKDVKKYADDTVHNSYIPDTIGSYMGIYQKMSQEAELTEGKAEGEEKSLKDKIFGFFGDWGGKIGAAVSAVWNKVTSLWSNMFTSTPDDPDTTDVDESKASFISTIWGQWEAKGGGIRGWIYDHSIGYIKSFINAVMGLFGNPSTATEEAEVKTEKESFVSKIFGEWKAEGGGIKGWIYDHSVGWIKNMISNVVGFFSGDKPTSSTEEGDVETEKKGFWGRIWGEWKDDGGGIRGWIYDHSVGWVKNLVSNLLIKLGLKKAPDDGTEQTDVDTEKKGFWTSIWGEWKDDGGGIRGWIYDHSVGWVKGLVSNLLIKLGLKKPEGQDTAETDVDDQKKSFFTSIVGSWSEDPGGGILGWAWKQSVGRIKGIIASVKGLFGFGGDKGGESDEDFKERLADYNTEYENAVSRQLMMGASSEWEARSMALQEVGDRPTQRKGKSGGDGVEGTEADDIDTEKGNFLSNIVGGFNSKGDGILGWAWDQTVGRFQRMKESIMKKLEDWGIISITGEGEDKEIALDIMAPLKTALDTLKEKWNGIMDTIAGIGLDIPTIDIKIPSFSFGGWTVGVGWAKVTFPTVTFGGYEKTLGGGRWEPFSAASNFRFDMSESESGGSLSSKGGTTDQDTRNNAADHVANLIGTGVNAVASGARTVGGAVIDAGSSVIDTAKTGYTAVKEKGAAVLNKLNPFSKDKVEPPKPGEPGGPPKYVPWDTISLIPGQIRLSQPYYHDPYMDDEWMYMQTGGKVPGPKGSLQPAMLHGGETVLPTHLDKGWLTSTKGGKLLGGGMGGGAGTVNMMNKPTTINIYTTENAVQAIENVERMQMMDEASFFTAV